jgi:hypothetical protein
MVQSLPPTLPATGPGTVTVRPSVRPINTDKHDEFRHFLHSLKEPLAGPAAGDQASVPEPRQGPREEREITGEQSSFGRANPDPSEWLAVFTSTGGVIEAHPAPAFTSQAPELSELVEGWVRRVAVGGDQRRAVARLDIGHGQFAGAELLITAEGRRVSVELTLPKGAGAGGLSERLSSRLAARGYAADVEVR